ncbi:DUF3806 domain-containing protein [Cellulomonas sp. URHB0016]
MSDVRPTLSAPGTATTGMRALTDNERQHLDGLRAHIRSSGIDTWSADAVGAFVHQVHASWALSGAPVPEGMVAALGVALGDLVVGGARGARWMMRTAGAGPTPAVVSSSGHAAVLPLDDVRARWDTGCAPAWGAGYVTAAAAHLAEQAETPTLPTPRASSESESGSTSETGTESGTGAGAGSGAGSGAGTETGTGTGTESRTETGTGTGVPAARAASGAHVASPRTPTDLPYPPSPSVQDLALRALERLLDAVVATGPSAVRPFAVVESGGRADIEEFDDTTAARAWVRGSGASCAAVAWVGTVPDDGSPAVLVEACDARRPSLRVAIRFSPARPAGAGRARPARAVGEPLVLGNGAPLL